MLLLYRVIEILELFEHPCEALKPALKKLVEEFDPDDPYWKVQSSHYIVFHKPLNSAWLVYDPTLRPILMGLGSYDRQTNFSPGKNLCLQIGLLLPEIYPIRVQRILTFVFNYKKMCRLFENILFRDKNPKLNSGKLRVKEVCQDYLQFSGFFPRQ